MLARLLLGLLLAGALAAPAPAEPVPSEAHASARKPKKKKRTKKKRSSSRRKKNEDTDEAPISLAELDVSVEAAAATVPSTLLVLGEAAGAPDVPVPSEPVAGVVTIAPNERRRRPTWFIGVRVGPGVMQRRGYYDFESNRQTYREQRNARGEVTVGRYLGRYLSLGITAGGGPFPKFDALDPIYEENTRFSVYPFHARLDLDIHAAWFVFGVGGGAAYEQTTGSFETRDAVTLEVVTHTATFKKRGYMLAARTGVQATLGPFTFELLAEASAVKLDRGTYLHEDVESPGLSDDETGYAASVLFGVKLQ